MSPEFDRAPLTLECLALLPGDNRADVYTRITQKQSGLQKSIELISSLKHEASSLKFNIQFINIVRMAISFQSVLLVLQAKLHWHLTVWNILLQQHIEELLLS